MIRLRARRIALAASGFERPPGVGRLVDAVAWRTRAFTFPLSPKRLDK